MKTTPSDHAGLAVVRTAFGGWPISATGMSRSSRGLFFDIRESSHGIELVVPPCDHYAVLVALGSSRLFSCDFGTLREISCRAGDLVVIPVGVRARLAGAIPALLRIGIDPERFREGSPLGEALHQKQTGSIVHANDLFALYLGGAIYEEMRKPEMDWRTDMLHPLVEALIVHFVTQYGIRAVSDHTGDYSDRDAIRRIVGRLRQTTHDFPDLSSLAHQAGLSRFHFIRVFKAETGMTPVRFVETCKIGQAKALIETSDLLLGDIADQLGFSDQSHLTRRFKKIVGLTPAAYARARGRLGTSPAR
jgi:AraC family transcriptional regulator